MKKKKLIIVSAAILVLLLIVISMFKSPKQTVLREAKLEPKDIRKEFRVAGIVTPRNMIPIKSPIRGRIEEVLVNEGDNVKKGQIIFWVSSSERAAMIDAARAISEDELKRWHGIYQATPVVAPMNGFIIGRKKEPGQTIIESDEVLRMADDLIVSVNIDETDFRYIKIGDKVTMFLDAYSDEYFEGIVEHIAYDSVPINNVIVYEVKIRPLKKPDVFRSGMTVTTIITFASKDDALSIPSIFITDNDGKKTVMVKSGNSRNPEFKEREVKLGISDDKNTEILSGLKSNEIVVVFNQKKKVKKIRKNL
ncbi:MAG: efflux RND transporter periplasmic adaptor subunit [Endomicrobium sp.]|jgi:macrolide-specific efflux system membrane fusion protein|nr:efflux RND transporter periplasmic adaptor subunit [Endomicrobium sp.]MDR2399194.1 efflux RND transporter periplasmic adaptor subunit [Endomicrobium sp.]